MSVSALSWALNQEVPRSSHKFVLMVLANYANENALCYPSIERLSQDTSQDRKTVLASLKSLKDSGFISDTGKRIGYTKSVIVYRLAMPQTEAVPKTGLFEAVPKTDVSSPVFPTKQSRFSVKQSQKRDTEPLGTVNEPSGTNNSVGKVSIWNLTKALEAAEKIAKDLKDRFAYEDGFGLHFESDEKRKEFQRAKNRVKELNQRIAVAV